MVARPNQVGYSQRMQHLPRSRYFRVVLAMALLAWTSLAFGASLGPMPMSAASMTGSPVQTTSHAASAQCDGTPIVHAASHHGHAPAMPIGHGDCCQSGCHCLAACGAVMTVPGPFTAQQYAQAPLTVLESANPTLELITPPLRPPII